MKSNLDLGFILGIQATLRNERTPVQSVWATGDPVANHAMGKALSEQVPQAGYIEVEETGHFIPIEAPDKVAKAFEEFVKQEV